MIYECIVKNEGVELGTIGSHVRRLKSSLRSPSLAAVQAGLIDVCISRQFNREILFIILRYKMLYCSTLESLGWFLTPFGGERFAVLRPVDLDIRQSFTAAAPAGIQVACDLFKSCQNLRLLQLQVSHPHVVLLNFLPLLKIIRILPEIKEMHLAERKPGLFDIYSQAAEVLDRICTELNMCLSTHLIGAPEMGWAWFNGFTHSAFRTHLTGCAIVNDTVNTNNGCAYTCPFTCNVAMGLVGLNFTRKRSVTIQ